MQSDKTQNDFSKGSILSHMFRLAAPMLLAELVHILYNIVDRIYIGHIEGTGTVALTGTGVALPLISLIGAFANICSTGGAPLCSIARGEGDNEKASAIQDTCFTLLLCFGVTLTVLLRVFAKPLLQLLGGTEESMPYAFAYFRIYVWGTVFSLISLGMNSFINMQGFARIGMGTVIIGAAANIVLDPLFIFTLNMGVAGAALATVLSQIISALWSFGFFRGKKAILPLKKLRLDRRYIGSVFKLGATGFCFKVTNSITQAAVNMVLKTWGGALSTIYIGAMSVITSIREVVQLPATAISGGAQPILGYNYGAKEYRRVLNTIYYETFIITGILLVMYSLLMLFPETIVGLFSEDPVLIELCVPCFRIFFCVYFFMAFQHTGQTTFVALNRPKFALFFSLLRKIGLILPLTLLLPRLGLGVKGVFWAEAVSELIGGIVCYTTMQLTVGKELRRASVS